MTAIILFFSSSSTLLLNNFYNILVDCQWTPWNYGSCSEPCGTGRRNRTRTISESQKFGGTCTGKSRELEYCNTNPCPGKIFVYNVEFLMIITWNTSVFHTDVCFVFPFPGCREFECKTGSCIDKKRRCDGKDDCNIYQEDNDFSDEDFCDRMYYKI